jgi:hypothetical protein
VSSDETGSAALAVIGAVAVVLLLAMWMSALAIAMRAHQAVTTAADAAALAAAPVTFLPFGAQGSPSQEAARFVVMNGAEMIWCRCEIDRTFEPRTVEVRVRRSVQLPILGTRHVEAIGRAEFVPAALLGG